MRHENSRKLYEYWIRLKADRSAPRREEIEPSDIRDLLGDTFILDVSGTLRTISYRLAGTRLCATFGKELKGQGFLVAWDETDCFEITRVISKVYRDLQPHIVSSMGKTDSGKFLELESVFLPLQPIGEQSFRILGITTPAEVPYWLGAEPIENISVRSMRVLEDSPKTKKEFAAPAISPDYGQLSTELPVENEGIRRVAHLTVHNGGKK